MSEETNKEPLYEELSTAPIPKTMEEWFAMAMEDTKLTDDNYIEKQKEQNNIRLKYVRYKYRYSVLLGNEKAEYDQYMAEQMVEHNKGNMIKDDKSKLNLIKSQPEHTRRIKKIATLQAIYDTISDAVDCADKIGYAVNNIIRQKEFERSLERGI